MTLRPFFSFFGAKWRAAKLYPSPEDYETIVEPFAGSACFSTRYAHKNVILIERDPVIAELWRYLIRATPDQIRALPLMNEGDDLRRMDLEEGAKALIGFWLNAAACYPRNTPSAWVKSKPDGNFWNARKREMIASQVEAIKHWRLIEGSYENAPDVEAYWFVDPPYHRSGKHYRFSSVDYAALASWCRSRRGRVVVCEQKGADWLPFEFLADVKANPSKRGKKKTSEVVWISDNV